MATLDELADALAREALEAAERLGDEGLIEEISKAIGDSSPTSQEAFLTAVRIRSALGRGRAVLDKRLSRRALPAPRASEDDGETKPG